MGSAGVNLPSLVTIAMSAKVATGDLEMMKELGALVSLSRLNKMKISSN